MKFLKNEKLFAVILLVIITLIASFIGCNATRFFTYEGFTGDDTPSYAENILNIIAPIVYDSTTTSTDKIQSIMTLNPPLVNTTINAIVGNTNDVDTKIMQIKKYISSCPTPDPVTTN